MHTPNSNGIIGDVARAASPELAYRIGQEFKENKILNQIDNGNRPEEQSLQHLLAHAILGAATSYATGNDIITGAISAVSNEAGAKILANYLYQTKDPETLSQEQKDTIVSILNLTTATTIYTATDGSTTDAVSGTEIGKVGVEWNNNIPLGSLPYYNSNDIAYFNQQIGMQEYCQKNPNVTSCQPRKDPIQPLKELYANVSIPEHTAYIGLGANTTPIKGGGIEAGIFYTTDGYYGMPDVGIYSSYAKTTGFGAGFGPSFGFVEGGRTNFNGDSKNNTTCAVIVCVGVNSNSNGENNGMSFSFLGNSEGGAVPGGSFTHAESNTGTISIGDIFGIKIGEK